MFAAVLIKIYQKWKIFSIVVLLLSSLLLIFVGVMRLSNPVKTYAKNSGIKLENDASLLNEMRGASAVMLCAGIIVFAGIFMENLTFTSHIVASLLFIGFVIGRLISVKTDGKPSKQIAQGIIFELVLGAANLFCLITIWQ